MNHKLIQNWNSIVNKNDTIYHLGDFGFAKGDQLSQIFDCLNGNKILIQGNHDQHGKKLPWSSKCNNCVITINNIKIYLSHYPDDQIHKSNYDFYFHGHCHNTLPNTQTRIDVGVDCWNFYPISFDQLEAKMEATIDPNH